jgi:hypothetical protein
LCLDRLAEARGYQPLQGTPAFSYAITAAADMTPAASDAPPSARVREAGCVVLGKTTMPDGSPPLRLGAPE